jgi:hypothetical protein
VVLPPSKLWRAAGTTIAKWMTTAFSNFFEGF